MYVCVYVCMYVCMYAFLYVFLYVCMYVCISVRMYVRMYVCMYVYDYEYYCIYRYVLCRHVFTSVTAWMPVQSSYRHGVPCNTLPLALQNKASNPPNVAIDSPEDRSIYFLVTSVMFVWKVPLAKIDLWPRSLSQGGLLHFPSPDLKTFEGPRGST